jgi:hypothetical protein
MEIEASNDQGRDADKIRYNKPEDVRLIERHYPVTQKGFSIALLEMRFPNMDYETQKRASKVINCLKNKRNFI